MFRQPAVLGVLGGINRADLEDIAPDDAVSLLSSELLSQARAGGLEFNPKPFIRAFEGAIEQLEISRRDIASHVAAVEVDVRSDGRLHSADADKQQQASQELFRMFDDLDRRLSDVSNAATRIGVQLETMDRVRLRARDVHDVIIAFNAANSGDVGALEALRPLGPDSDRQTALLLRRLNLLSGEVDGSEMEVARRTVEKYSEKMEQSWLEAFSAAHLVGDVTGMRTAANTLTVFNNGSSCRQLYVTQHSFFRDHAAKSPSYSSDGMAALLDDVEQVYMHELDVLSDVFPDPIPVINHLLQRIFAETIQDYQENLQHEAQAVSTLAYLRSLHSCHRSAQAFVTRLEAFLKMREMSPSSATILIQVLKQGSEDLFVPYLEGSKYVDKEATHLSDALAGLIGVDHTLGDAASPSRSLLDIIKQMLVIHAESMERATDLSYTQQLAKNAYRLFQILLDNFERHLESEIERGSNKISTPPRSEPDVSVLSLVRDVSQSIQLLDLHLRTMILPLLPAALQHEAALYKNAASAKLSRSTDRLLSKMLKAMSSWASVLLSRQNPDDFQPRDEFDATNNRATTACLQTVSYFRGVRDAVVKRLPKDSVIPVLTELAMQFYGRLLDHCRSYPVSYTGALVMTKDLTQYYETLASWEIPALTERLGLLKELASLFVVSPDNLQTVLSEGFLSRIRPQLLTPYLALREDWPKFTEAQKQLLTGDERESTGAQAPTGAGPLFPVKFPSLITSNKLLDYLR